MLLAVLDARFAPLPPGLTSRLEAVTGVERLDRLVRKAAVATALDDVLRDVDSRQVEQPEP